MKRTRRVEAVDKVSATTCENTEHISGFSPSAIFNLQNCASFVEIQ